MAESSASDLERLLVVQGHDTHLDQLHHKRDTLPELATVAAAQDELSTADRTIAGVEGERDALAREQRRLEDEISGFEDRITKADKQLYGGTVSNLRELQALQDDIESLKRQQSTREDAALELMEQIEPLQAQVEQLRVQRAEIEARFTHAAAQLTASQATIDAELDAVLAERATSADGIASPLVDEYDKLRKGRGGVAIARLVGGRCEGCHLSLSAVEVDRIKHLASDELVHCEECGRMLVH